MTATPVESARAYVQDQDPLFGNFCLYCGNDCSTEQSFCSSICELQDLQRDPYSTSTGIRQRTNEETLPSLIAGKGSHSSYSSSSNCSSSPSTANNSPANALGATDELTAEVSAFHLPPSVLQQQPKSSTTKEKRANFDYSYGYAEAKDLKASVDTISPLATSVLSLMAGKTILTISPTSKKVKSKAAPSPNLTPTDVSVKLERTKQQQPESVAPRRTSSDLLSPILRPVKISSSADAQTFVKTVNGPNKKSPMIQASNLSPLFRPKTAPALPLVSTKACGKTGCPALTSRPALESRRASCPLDQARSRLSFSFANEEEVVERGRSRRARPELISQASSETSPTKTRSESAHLLSCGDENRCSRPEICARDSTIKPGSRTRASDPVVKSSSRTSSSTSTRRLPFHRMTPIIKPADQAESAIVSSDSEDDDRTSARDVERGRSAVSKDTTSVDGRGRSKRRDGTEAAAYRRSRSRHREQSR